MSREVITAEQVQQVAVGGTLSVSERAIITPLARDVAAERRVTIARGAPSVVTQLPSATADGTEAKIREIVARVLAGGGGLGVPAAAPSRPSVKLARIAESPLEPFPFPGPGPDQKVHAVDVVTTDDGSPIAAGYMSLTEGAFEWTLNYDEVQIVLEGELHLGLDGGNKVGRSGDIFYVPKGSTITFGTPSWAKFIYVTFPADWAEQ
ncbi:cupin domain-containing protein [Tessaracoccus caeni]|uniref:cupin domain-containing protein n=1 Tax=Tessaracoccus caeni TaxID=3031239 RepID=UPI0023DA46E8|nr:cupin domain-containing protein [Tessaracoccus caeni]MDF1490080.1 cupin domain-containing protein [Tessaracoccus caeni]